MGEQLIVTNQFWGRLTAEQLKIVKTKLAVFHPAESTQCQSQF